MSLSTVSEAAEKSLSKVGAVADYLCVSTKTIYQWAELDQIPHVKINGALRFDLDDIREWVLNCKKATDSGYNQPAKTVAGPKKGGNR